MSITTAVPTPRSAPSPAPSGSNYTLPGVSWLSLDLEGANGTLSVGSTSVDVHVHFPIRKLVLDWKDTWGQGGPPSRKVPPEVVKALP